MIKRRAVPIIFVVLALMLELIGLYISNNTSDGFYFVPGFFVTNEDVSKGTLALYERSSYETSAGCVSFLDGAYYDPESALLTVKVVSYEHGLEALASYSGDIAANTHLCWNDYALDTVSYSGVRQGYGLVVDLFTFAIPGALGTNDEMTLNHLVDGEEAELVFSMERVRFSKDIYEFGCAAASNENWILAETVYSQNGIMTVELYGLLEDPDLQLISYGGGGDGVLGSFSHLLGENRFGFYCGEERLKYQDRTVGKCYPNIFTLNIDESTMCSVHIPYIIVAEPVNIELPENDDVMSISCVAEECDITVRREQSKLHFDVKALEEERATFAVGVVLEKNDGAEMMIDFSKEDVMEIDNGSVIQLTKVIYALITELNIKIN